MSLRAKVILLATGSIAILAGLVFGVLSRALDEQMRSTVRGDIAHAKRVLARLLEDHGTRLRSEAELVAGLTTSRDLTQSGAGVDRATADDMAKELCSKIGADAILFVNRSGKVMAQAKSSPNASSPRANGPSVTAAMAGNSVVRYVVDGEKIRVTGAVPVRLGGFVWGAICISEDVDARLARQLSAALGFQVGFQVKSRMIGLEGLDQKSAQTKPNEISIRSVYGQDVIVMRDRFPGEAGKNDASIVAMRPASEVLGPFEALKRALGVSTLFALVLSVLLAIYVGKRTVRPLENVVKAAQAVQAGSWPEPFHTKRTDEYGVLMLAFDQMTASIREAQERMLALLDTDVLTELANHRSFQERLAEETARSLALQDPLSMVLFDIDHFQEFNHVHGHGEGDRLLKLAADVVTRRLPDFGFAGRYGGEEIAVLLPNFKLQEAEVWAEELRVALADAFRETFGADVTVSLGCAQSSGGEGASGLDLAAELAMAKAKQLGRNRVCRFDPVDELSATKNTVELQSFLAEGSYATMQALAAAVDAKDPYTQGHSQRVADYAAALAKRIGMSEEDVALIHITGTLHDVGKIGVPDAILQKPGRLDDEERRVMETHPVLGEVIVRKAPQLAATLPGVRHHHERWDGKGYPDGLSGESIPYMARVLALADTFDAMTSDRPYRKGLDLEIALGEIEKNAGTQFDPDLAPEFVALMRERMIQRAA